ncbi:RHS repeat-associated core domain-containing protein [Pseudomonas sp. MAG733B]|uniref:RHS repeat-associated core domain-containing protein n=1 Tax=Pseudomonas sp. MAG733B TaxID=3122079 RepID=UPI0030D37D03
MSTPHIHLLCRNLYDPLDRLIGQTHPDIAAHQRFYCNSRLTTEIQGALHYSFVQHEDHLLAQKHYLDNKHDTTLLATDLQRSVLQALEAGHQRRPIAYTTYGHRIAESGLSSLLGFNGERPDPVTGHYLLGNGYRAFNPVLLRFNSPDSLSPFGKGGLNSYAYCLGDPINLTDSDGHSVIPVAIAGTRWRRFVPAQVAARVERKLIDETRTIQLAYPADRRVSLKPGVTVEQAIEARRQTDRLNFLGKNDRLYNEKFLNDYSIIKRESALLERNVGIPASQNEQLKLMNYIKAGRMKKGEVYSSERLIEAAENGNFDPEVRLNDRPSQTEAIIYYRNLQGARNPSAFRYMQEARRIREQFFIL